jgi:hypothetical protein
MTATKNAFQARANEKAQEEMNDLYNNTVGYYMPSAILARAQTWVADQFWAVVSSCVFFLVAGLILACTFGHRHRHRLGHRHRHRLRLRHRLRHRHRHRH